MQCFGCALMGETNAQDFRTGYLTLTSGRSMVAAQLLGSLIGCIVAPLTFMMFWNAFPIQVPGICSALLWLTAMAFLIGVTMQAIR